MLGRYGMKLTRSLEGVAANGTTAGPEGGGGTGLAAVGVVVKQVAEAAHDPRGGGAVVVAAEHCRQGWISAETGSDALDRSGVQFHIGIHEQQDLATGRSGGQVASGGRPLPLVDVQKSGAALQQPGGRGWRHPVEHHQGLVAGLQPGQGYPGAAAKGVIPADGRHHQGEGG